MARRKRIGSTRKSKQDEMTRKLVEASGINNPNPLTDPEQRKDYYVIDAKDEGAKYYGKKRKAKD